MIRRVFALALTILVAGIAAADKPAAIELGFKPEKVYSFDSLDNVNLFNGNLIFTVPLGLKYPVGGNLSYGLTLVYNAKAWDYFYVESAARPDDIRAWAKPNVRSNAGMGWRVSLGRLIPPSQFTSTSGYAEVDSAYWTYESPAGDEHQLARRDAAGTVSHAHEFEETYTSNANIRMVVVNTTTRQIQFPNGEIHTFLYERNAWRLKKMEDAFGNAVNVTYTYASTSDTTTAWTISDAFGRQHVVSFTNSPYLSDTIDRGQIVSSITMRGYGATTTNVTYTFNYNTAASVAYGCEHTISTTDTNFNPRPTSTRATVPLLTSVTLPDGSAWAFNYYFDDATPGDCSSGLLKEVTLPTLGKMSYTYQKYDIPANDWCTSSGPSTSSGGVRTRTVDGKTWEYKQTIGPIAINYTSDPGMKFTCGTNAIDGEQGQYFPQPAYRWKRTSVIAPPYEGAAAARTDHYFSLWRSRHGEVDSTLGAHVRPTFEYGAPGTAGWPGAASAKLPPVAWESAPDVSAADVPSDPAKRYLVQQTWTGCVSGGTSSGDCSATTAALLRSQYSLFATFSAMYRMPSSERTVYHDDTCPTGTCYTQNDYSDHNGAGRLRQVVETGNFRGETTATNRTEYAAWTLTNLNSASVKWITGNYSEKKRTIGTKTARTLYCFGASGELLKTRALTNPAAESSTDVVEVYSYINGNVNSIKTYGGDHAAYAVPTGSLCSLTLSGAPQYENQYSWAYGGLTTEWAVDTATGYGLLFNSRDYSRHSGTGLVTQSRATDGLPTNYTYTAWGALSAVTPPGETQTTYTYAKATATTRAKVTVARGDETIVHEYDGMGRLAREQKTLPGAGCVQRLVTYDAFSRIAAQTSWHGCTASSPGSTTWTYDAFGRVVSVKTPDNKTSTMTYLGGRAVKRITNDVALLSGMGTWTATNEEYDRFGRLIQMKEAETASAAPTVTALYTYDAADRLTSVTMGSQTRTFTYDGRGFLTSEQHPELSNPISYREYDARGHAWRKTIGADAGPFDIRLTWDPAERVILIKRVSDDRPLKQFVYDDPDDIYCGGQICRGKLAAAARYHWDSDLSNVAGGESLAVTESYKYDVTTGRVTRRDRAIGNTSLFTGNSFYTFQTHDTNGQLTSISYPCSDIAGCPGGVQRVVNYGYTNGALTSVGNYAPSITYAPSGIIDTVTHGTSGAAGLEVWTRDPSGMPRPLTITAKTTANVTRWTSGNYAYDGGGNIRSIGGLSYNYDALNRLVRWTTNNADGSSTWSGREYDRYGNPLYNTSGSCGTGGLNCTSTNGATRTITGVTNRYADAGYDASGNVTSDGGRTFSYDALGMMTRATISGRAMRYLYSVDDERIAAVERVSVGGIIKNKTTYTIRGFASQLLAVWVTDPTTSAATWVEDEIWRGSSLLARESASKGTTHYFLDHLGSPRAITNTAGTLLGTQTFDPWGNGGTSDGGSLQFTAHERDAATFGSGNAAFPDYMHARYYDMGAGRFLAVDPKLDLDRALHGPQSWNRYSYVENNPLIYTDPTGMNIFKEGWDWLVNKLAPEKPDNDRARQAKQLADEGVITQGEANSQNAATYRRGLKEGVSTLGAEFTQAGVTLVLFKGTGKALNFAAGKLTPHFAKHMAEFGYATEAEYLAGARAVAGEAVAGAAGIVTKTRGTDTLIYKAVTNEFVVVTKDNVIRTYFKPLDGVTYFLSQ